MSTTQQQFSFNIAFTVPVNGAGETPILSTSDLWESLRYGARHPHEMAPYIANGEVLPGGSELEFRRRLTVADGGAVHTAAGGIIYQDVVFYPMLSVRLGCFAFVLPYCPGSGLPPGSSWMGIMGWHGMERDKTAAKGRAGADKRLQNRLRRPPLLRVPRPLSPFRGVRRARRTCT
jgi:hypothetical protein